MSRSLVQHDCDLQHCSLCNFQQELQELIYKLTYNKSYWCSSLILHTLHEYYYSSVFKICNVNWSESTVSRRKDITLSGLSSSSSYSLLFSCWKYYLLVCGIVSLWICFLSWSPFQHQGCTKLSSQWLSSTTQSVGAKGDEFKEWIQHANSNTLTSKVTTNLAKAKVC